MLNLKGVWGRNKMSKVVWFNWILEIGIYSAMIWKLGTIPPICGNTLELIAWEGAFVVITCVWFMVCWLLNQMPKIERMRGETK